MKVVARLARFIGCTKGMVLAGNFVMLYVSPATRLKEHIEAYIRGQTDKSAI